MHAWVAYAQPPPLPPSYDGGFLDAHLVALRQHVRRHVGDRRHAAERHQLVGRALDADQPVDDLQVVGADLEHARRDAQHLVLDAPRREARRADRHARGAAAAGADEAERRRAACRRARRGRDSSGTPISSATIWASVVSWLWPCGAWAVNTVTCPSISSRTRACSGTAAGMPTDGRNSRGPGANSIRLVDADSQQTPFGPRALLLRAEAAYSRCARARGPSSGAGSSARCRAR